MTDPTVLPSRTLLKFDFGGLRRFVCPDRGLRAGRRLTRIHVGRRPR